MDGVLMNIPPHRFSDPIKFRECRILQTRMLTRKRFLLCVCFFVCFFPFAAGSRGGPRSMGILIRIRAKCTLSRTGLAIDEYPFAYPYPYKCICTLIRT